MTAAEFQSEAGHYHGLDILRSAALLLGVVFHAAMPVLMPDYAGLAAQPIPSEVSVDPGLRLFMEWSQIWRMPAFFVLAGFFAQMTLVRKGPAAFLADRAVRIFGVLVLFCLLFAALSGGSPLVLGHLWFLWFLSLMCLLAIIFWHVPSGAIARAASWTTASAPRLVLLFGPVVIASVLGREGLSAPVPLTVLDIQPWSFVFFWVFFLIGQALWIGRARIDDLARRPVFASLLMVAACLFLTLDNWTPGSLGFHVMASATTMLFVLGLIGVTHALLARPDRFVTLAVRTAYPVYVFHVAPAIAISVGLLSLGIDGTATVILSSMLTILLCLAFYVVLVRYSPMDWLFSGYAKSWFKWPWRANGWS